MIFQLIALFSLTVVFLGIGFSAVSLIEDKCFAIATAGVCKSLYTILAALQFFFVVYLAVFWMNKIRKKFDTR
jgi:hypothetical protein